MSEKASSRNSLQIHASKIFGDANNFRTDFMRPHIKLTKQPSNSSFGKVLVSPGTKLANLILSAEKTLSMIRAQKKNSTASASVNIDGQGP